MSTPGKLIDVSAEELDVVLDRLQQTQATELAIIGPTFWLGSNPNDWPDEFRGKIVHRLRKQVPDVIARVIRHNQWRELVLCGLNLGEGGARAIAERLTNLTSLDVDSSNIGEKGVQAIAAWLTNLTSLNVGQNDIGEGSARAVAERLTNLTSLNVRNNNIGEGGARAIAEELTKLTSLDVGRNNIGVEGARAIAEELTNLTSLNVRNNNIGAEGARAISERLTNLTSLNVRNNNISVEGARAISERLVNLTSLNVEYNGIGEEGTRAIAERLNNLTSLIVGNNDIGEQGARAVAVRLNNLISLNVENNDIGEEGARAIAEQLTNLTSLNVGENKIGEGGARVIAEQLTNLTALDVGDNKIGEEGVRVIAERLANLTSLDLCWNSQIHDLRRLAELPALRFLNVRSTSVSDLSPFTDRIKAGWPVRWDHSSGEGLNVRNCPLKTPPIEIASQGPEAVRNYFLERERQGTVRLYEAKVLIIGQGGAGKTTLLRRLYQPDLPMPGEDETTRGIDIHQQDFAGHHNGPFRLNVWDFGGQQIYHATHQFFLTKSSLYVLVDDTRKDDKSIQDESFKFWLEVVETLSEKSPVLIFQNEKGGRSKTLDQPGIKGRFPNVIGVYSGNLEDKQAADQLRQAIQLHVQQLPHVGQEFLSRWLEVRTAVEAEAQTKPFISQDDYFKIYSRHLEFDRTRALHLSRYLHDLGVFLHFQDDLLLKKTVILQNQWATDAVFRVLDDETTKKNLGQFTLADCSRLWHEDKYADMHAELIGLMKKFELCYQLPDTQPERWLAPQLLPPSKPALFDGWAQPSDLVVRFKYPFLPRGLVSRLMVRQHRFARQLDRSWARGAFFEHHGTAVLVEETLRGNEIEFRARGPERKELLSVLAGDLEALNDSFEGLRGKVEKLVPCICSICAETTDPEMYRQSELVERRSRGKRTIECRREPYEDVNVLKLLDGIEVGQMPDWAKAPPEAGTCETPLTESTTTRRRSVKIFLASSAELRKDRDEFDLYFRQANDSYVKQGLYLQIERWETFLDAMSETRSQDEYNRKVRDSDIVLCLFKTKVGKFTEEEFDVAYGQFKATGTPKIFTYFKEYSISSKSAKLADLKSLEDFKEKLNKMGHFYTNYKSPEHLKRHFGDQLKKLFEQEAGN